MRIPLRRGGIIVAHALVNSWDAHLAKHRWSLSPQGYARTSLKRNGRVQSVWMHREVLGLGPGRDDPRLTDHWNMDKLGNRRGNLRACTPAESAQNQADEGWSRSSSRYRGVNWNKQHQMWMVRVMLNRRSHFLGMYADEDRAGAVAAEFRREHMPFAREADAA